ncbi:MAG TPA: hypothetical protein VEI57_09640 [Nitrospirota bacterium]|nr:hypothetical protein [Nitrospirota bacterium]
MRRLFVIIFLLPGALFLGCGGVKNIIEEKAISARTDIFREMQAEEALSKGFSDLLIRAQLKTHLEGHYILEPRGSFHGKPKYPFVFNVDGQAIIWEVDGKKEDMPEYDDNGIKTQDGGEGMRYSLDKRIRLAVGPHKIFFALPGDKYYVQFEVILEERSIYTLEFKPIYNRYRNISQDYLRGIKRYEIFLNEKRLL